MKSLFLDHDGVICLSNNWGSRWKKQREVRKKLTEDERSLPVHARFDNIDGKAIKVLNEIIEKTNAEIVVTSDWRNWCTVDEMGEYYESQGIIKKPISFTKFIQDCDYEEDFPWSREWDLEQTRSIEIKQYLREHPEITHWVAVDDLNMGKKIMSYGMEYVRDWALDNFVLTRYRREGIKQCGVKEKIISYLK